MQLLSGQKLKGKEVEEAAMWKCIETHNLYPTGVPFPKLRWNGAVLDEAYKQCGDITAEYAKTFYLGTQLMTPKQAKAIWAIYVWCRRTDELVDGPNASRITPKVITILRKMQRWSTLSILLSLTSHISCVVACAILYLA